MLKTDTSTSLANNEKTSTLVRSVTSSDTSSSGLQNNEIMIQNNDCLVDNSQPNDNSLVPSLKSEVLKSPTINVMSKSERSISSGVTLIQIIKEELPCNEATEDESLAVEALWQLGGGKVNEMEKREITEHIDLPVETCYSPAACTATQAIHCGSCSYSCSAIDALHLHRSICESRVKQIYTCSVCNQAFDKKQNFDNHMVGHKASRPYSCRLCSSLFALKSELQNHTCPRGLRNLCHLCGIDFAKASSLTNHMKVHCYVPGRALIEAAIAKNDNTLPIQNSADTTWSNPQISAPLTPPLSSDLQGWNINLNVHNSLTTEDLPESIDMAEEATASAAYQHIDTHPSFNPDLVDIHQDPAISTSDYQQSINEEPSMNIINSSSVQVESLPYTNAHVQVSDALNFLPKVQGDTKEKLKPHSCRFCGVAFTRAKALISHERLHEDSWSDCVECRKCGETFANRLLHKNHTCQAITRPKDNNKPMYSKQSSKTSPNLTDRRYVEEDVELQEYLSGMTEEHAVKPVTNLKQNKYSCAECNKGFTTKQKMYRHMWIHRKKTFSCEVCGESFSLQKQLDEHRLSQHPGNTPHGCTSCGKCFASRQGLWEHSRTHREGAAPHTCHVCSKEFTSRQGFLIHSRTHTGERPYGCRYCWKAFRDGGTLRKHERIHTGERPHICPLCLRSFNQKVVLREHVRWVHAATEASDSNLPCPLCPQVLSDRDDLCSHIVKHSDMYSNTSRGKQKTVMLANTTTHKPDKTIPKKTIKSERGPSAYVISEPCYPSLQDADDLDDAEDVDGGVACDMCGDHFVSRELLLAHVGVHI